MTTFIFCNEEENNLLCGRCKGHAGDHGTWTRKDGRPPIKCLAWALAHNQHGPFLDSLTFLPDGKRPEDVYGKGDTWIRLPWLDGLA
jgi:hypothetical protein